MRALLSDAPDLDVVAEAEDASSAEALVRARQPDLVVTDLDLPDRNAILLTRALRESGSRLPVVVLSAKAPDAVVHQAMQAGANGYAFKCQSAAEILAALRGVVQGEQVFPPVGGQNVAADALRVARSPRGASLDRLSAREREIFDLIIWGQTNKQVAQRLGISVKTVETHRSHINGKLQVHSGAELVRLASLWGALVPARGSALSEAALGHPGPMAAAIADRETDLPEPPTVSASDNGRPTSSV